MISWWRRRRVPCSREPSAMLPIPKTFPVHAARRTAVAVEVRAPSLGIWFAAIAATVRADGLFLSTYHDLPHGTRVEVQIALPDGPAVDVTGVVADHPFEGTGIDISFDDLSEIRARVA